MSNTEVKSLTLDYSKWRCGGDGMYKIGGGETCLVNKEGFMCCLGQFCKQLGIPESEMLEMGEPADLKAEISQFASYQEEMDRGRNTELSNQLIKINDDEDDLVADKIKRIKHQLEQEGIELIVINQPENEQ